MILHCLAAHLASRYWQYRLPSVLLSALRCTRVYGFYDAHRRLCAMPSYRDFVALPANDDVFHHLSHRFYLLRGLSARERVQALLAHYAFEETMFSQAYREAIYRDGGLTVWTEAGAQAAFRIALAMAPRVVAEGELVMTLYADDMPLHRLNFNWAPGRLFGLDQPMLAVVVRNQGRSPAAADAMAAFDAAFVNNSPSFFCFAAMQGIAQAVGIASVIGVRGDEQVAYDASRSVHFTNAYDQFWLKLGGVALPRRGYLIAVPFYRKSLLDMPAKRRKRAAARRQCWDRISTAACTALQAQRLSHG